jgi:hypothetical protein
MPTPSLGILDNLDAALEDIRHEEAEAAEIERLLRERVFSAVGMGFDVRRKQGRFKYKDVLEGDIGNKWSI